MFSMLLMLLLLGGWGLELWPVGELEGWRSPVGELEGCSSDFMLLVGLAASLGGTQLKYCVNKFL